MTSGVSLAMSIAVCAPAGASMLVLGAWVLADQAMERRTEAAERVRAERVDETVPLPVGRWSQ